MRQFWLAMALAHAVSWTTEIRGAPSAPLLPCTFPCLFCLDLTLSDCDSAVPLTVNYFASDEECTWCWHGWIHFTLICTVSSTEGKKWLRRLLYFLVLTFHLLVCFEAGSHVVQADHELFSMLPRMTLNVCFSCLYLWSARNIGVSCHAASC